MASENANDLSCYFAPANIGIGSPGSRLVYNLPQEDALQMQRAAFLSQLLTIVCLIRPGVALSSELWIQPHDATGRSLRLSRAEVYLDIWGHGYNAPLVQSERGVKLPLDRSWPCSAWPQVCGENALWGARVILQAEGYATVTSNRFFPLGAEDPRAGPTGTSVDTVIITFEGIPEVRIKEGETKEVKLPFRRPTRRIIRISDETGKPLAGVRVIDRLLFARSNHCGAVEGDILAQGETDTSGEMIVPDVAGERAFQMNELRHFALLESRDAEIPIIAIRRLRTPVTTIVLRALEKKSLLRLEFTNDGIPAAGLQLMSCVDHCCGACCGTLEGETDQNGRVLLKDYYPELIRLVLMERSGGICWQGNVPEPSGEGWTKIEIRAK